MSRDALVWSESSMTRALRCCRAEGELDADLIARAVASRLGDRVQDRFGRERVLALERAGPALLRPLDSRTPYYCSGLPTQLLDGRDGRRARRVGIAVTRWCCSPGGKARSPASRRWAVRARSDRYGPFTESPHFFQNVGDRTTFHHGFAGAAGGRRGGRQRDLQAALQQRRRDDRRADVICHMAIPELTRWLELEGVKRVIITAVEPERYEGATLSSIAEVRRAATRSRRHRRARHATPG